MYRSLALLSEDESVLHYFGLSPEGEGTHAHVGTFPRQNTGSGVAISLRKPVLTTKHAPRRAPAALLTCQACPVLALSGGWHANGEEVAECTAGLCSGRRRLDWQQLERTTDASACICLPLTVADKALGTLNIASPQTDAFRGCVLPVQAPLHFAGLTLVRAKWRHASGCAWLPRHGLLR